MTRSASAAGLRKFAKGLVVALLASVAALYAAGYYFLWWAKQEPYSASPLTVARYWYYYGDRPQVRAPLLWSLGGGFGTIGLVGVMFLLPRKRSLHGDARLRGLDYMGIDHQMLYPTTLYARMTSDGGFEAALMRSYNRYVGKQCRQAPERLKWAGLLPLRDTLQGCEAVAEMTGLGATAAVVYGTAGDRLLSDRSFTPVWDELHRSGLPLCVHMGMSYPPFLQVCNGLLAAHGIGMSLPAMMAFVAIVGHGMLDRYPNLKVGFLEFGAEWILYMVARLDHYLPIDRSQMPIKDEVPQRSIEEYARSGRIFIAGEADDKMLPQEIELLGEEQILYSSDLPHGEGRHNAAKEILARDDISEAQKRKILYDNAVRFFGEP
jgi:predicted TIM-barrel fold metal-dependent hydrolase